MTRHGKSPFPSDRDLKVTPFIGGSKGVRRAQASADDLAEFAGETTIEGDVANDVNRQGGIDKQVGRGSRSVTRP